MLTCLDFDLRYVIDLARAIALTLLSYASRGFRASDPALRGAIAAFIASSKMKIHIRRFQRDRSCLGVTIKSRIVTFFQWKSLKDVYLSAIS